MSKLLFNPNKLDPKGKEIYETLSAKRKRQGAPFDGPYAALMNHPELCEKIENLGYYLKFQGHLPRDIYQFIVLSVAKETNASFEWNDHVEHAREAGVPQSIIDSLKEHGILEQEPYPQPYHIAARVLNSTLLWKNIPQDVQEEAISKYGVQGFIEIVVLSGFYQMFSAINQGLDIGRKGISESSAQIVQSRRDKII